MDEWHYLQPPTTHLIKKSICRATFTVLPYGNTANYCKTWSKSPEALKFWFVANTCEPRHEVPQEQHSEQVYVYEHVRMITESLMNCSMKAAVSCYVKKAEFGINKHFCVQNKWKIYVWVVSKVEVMIVACYISDIFVNMKV